MGFFQLAESIFEIKIGGFIGDLSKKNLKKGV